MKKLLFIIFIMFSILSYSREIHIGDLIKVKLTTDDLNLDDIKEKFKDFELEKIEKKGEDYYIEFRVFETGKKEIEIGDKTLEINIAPLVKDTNTGMKESEAKLKKAKLIFPLSYFLLFLGIVLFIFLIYKLILFLKKKKENSLSPYELFLKNISNMKYNKEDYFFNLSFLLKKYLNSKYNKNISGKTSKEIMKEIEDIEINEKENLKKWFEFCDLCKYASYSYSEDEKINQTKILKEIVKNIENTEDLNV